MKKKYVITDPCYIIPDGEYTECGEVTDYGDGFNEALAGYLTKVTGEQAYVSNTGYGDWCNEIVREDNIGTIINRDFCADAGLVCVCLLTPKIEAMLREYPSAEKGLDNQHLAAIIELDDVDKISVDFKGADEGWCVVEINHKGRTIFRSLREQEDDEDNDDCDW